jgi:heptosyltransferase-2
MPKRILIINPFGIGDVLFCTPLIRNIRFYYPDAFIAVAVQKKVVPVLENNPNINRVIPFSRGDFKDLSRKSRLKAMGLLFRTLGEIRRCRFDLCIDLSLEHRYSLFLKLLGVKQRIGFNYKHRGRFLTHRINIDGYDDRHVVEYHLELLKFLGKRAEFYNTEIFLRQEERDWAEAFLDSSGVARDDSIIGVIPGGGASWGRQSYLKHWPKESFIQVADRLSEKLGAKIIIFAGSLDREIAEDIIQKMHQPAINVIAKADLRQFIALVGQCDLIITNDGGPLHIAVALGVKSVSVFGPVDEQIYGPYPPAANYVVIKKDFPCRPCYRKFRVPECNYQLCCLEGITVGEVYDEAEKLLKYG